MPKVISTKFRDIYEVSYYHVSKRVTNNLDLKTNKTDKDIKVIENLKTLKNQHYFSRDEFVQELENLQVPSDTIKDLLKTCLKCAISRFKAIDTYLFVRQGVNSKGALSLYSQGQDFKFVNIFYSEELTENKKLTNKINTIIKEKATGLRHKISCEAVFSKEYNDSFLLRFNDIDGEEIIHEVHIKRDVVKEALNRLTPENYYFIMLLMNDNFTFHSNKLDDREKRQEEDKINKEIQYFKKNDFRKLIGNDKTRFKEQAITELIRILIEVTV